MHHLRLCEAHDLLKELEDREERASRLGFIHQRFTAGIIYKTLTGKMLDITFPWEEEDDAEGSEDGGMTEEEIAETRRMLQELNKKNNED